MRHERYNKGFLFCFFPLAISVIAGFLKKKEKKESCLFSFMLLGSSCCLATATVAATVVMFEGNA